eukprot:COSAG02_NODE_208_length_29027_cov_27.870230_24_plen_108_part_00
MVILPQTASSLTTVVLLASVSVQCIGECLPTAFADGGLRDRLILYIVCTALVLVPAELLEGRCVSCESVYSGFTIDFDVPITHAAVYVFARVRVRVDCLDTLCYHLP